MFQFHPRLLEDCHVLGRFPLCHVLLMNDTNYPWFILVPDRPGLTELYQLSPKDQTALMAESTTLSKALVAAFDGDKLNVAALGNLVPQLHIHHVVRFRTDPTWPAPVWGKLPAVAYSDENRAEIIAKLKALLAADVEFYV